jgi:hypothetical protein
VRHHQLPQLMRGASGGLAVEFRRLSMASPDRRKIRDDQDVELLRSSEQERLRALVSGDMERAAQLHSDDFQLINPLGGVLSKEQYLGGIRSGQIRYLYWEPEAISVRVYGDVAALRYRSQLEIVVQGRHIPRQQYWHTDLYERHGPEWRVVWSHATAAS